ncbi:MAG: hypothetical protein ACLPN5_09065 [Roseiarcus sp.]
MLRKLAPVVAALLILAAGAIALLYYAHTGPSTEALDADLKAVQAEIKLASEEGAAYNGGLIKFMIEARKQILQTSAAMLELKRTSMLRRIDLKYHVDGKALVTTDDAGLKVVEQEIERTKSKLQVDQTEVDRYSGGLLQTMAMVTAATDQASLSQLYLAYYARKYGLALPDGNVSGASEGPARGPPGKVVKDKDAL